MSVPPRLIDEAHVVSYASLDGLSNSGVVRHRIDGEDAPEPAALAIATYGAEPGFYLFYCDADWSVITDTFHDSLDDAVAQAVLEFPGVSFVHAR